MKVILELCLLSAFSCSARDLGHDMDRYIISCHTTDYSCFRRQYRALRDHVYIGNEKLGIDDYEPHLIQYGDTGTCIKFSGWENSEIFEMGMGSGMFSLSLGMPLKIQQVINETRGCAKPRRAFGAITENGTNPVKSQVELKKFIGNATVQVIFRYEIRRRKIEEYMLLLEDNIDVVFDIPEFMDYDKTNPKEVEQHQVSEWAYEVVQHVNLAVDFALPFTKQIRVLFDRVPVKRFLALYPEEEYYELNFLYSF